MKNRNNSTLIILSNATSFLGIGMNFIAASWVIISITQNPLYVSLLVAFQSIPAIFFSPITGAITDLYNNKKIAIFADLFRGFITLIVPIMLLLDIHNMHIFLYFQTFLVTVMGSLFFPSLSSIMKECIPEDNFFKVISTNTLMSQISILIGGVIAGFLISMKLTYVVFIIDSLSYIISAFFIYLIEYQSKKNTENLNFDFNSYTNNIIDGLKYITKNEYLIILLIMSIIPSTVTTIINSLLSGYTKFSLNQGAKIFGFLEASFSGGSIIIGIISTFYLSKKFNSQKIYIIGYFLMVLGLLLLGINPNITSSIISLILLGGGAILMGPSRKTLLLKNVDAKYIGRVESMNFMLFSSIGPIIAMFISLLVNHYSYENIFLILSIILVFLFLILYKLENLYK